MPFGGQRLPHAIALATTLCALAAGAYDPVRSSPVHVSGELALLSNGSRDVFCVQPPNIALRKCRAAKNVSPARD
jgi:hypothetical protein